MEKSNADIFISQFNETIDKWISYLDSYTLEMLYQKPATGEWSLGQVYVHIIEDTQFYIEQGKAALLTENNSDRGMNKNGRAIFENNAFPDMQLTNPFNSLDLRQPENKVELLQGLTTLKSEVNELYATVDFATSLGKTEHPGFQYFSALEWLCFAEMHMRHHLRQKKRIDDELFPSLSEIPT